MNIAICPPNQNAQQTNNKSTNIAIQQRPLFPQSKALPLQLEHCCSLRFDIHQLLKAIEKNYYDF